MRNWARLCYILGHLGKPRCIEQALCLKNKEFIIGRALGGPVTCCRIFLLRKTVTILFFFSEIKKRKHLYVLKTFLELFLESFVL